MQRMLITILAVFVPAVASAQLAAAQNWPGFRGPTGQGYVGDNRLPSAWGGAEHKNVLWSAPLIGQGHASPIVWGDRVFVCTAAWAPGVVAREKVIPAQHLLCYGATDGRLLWDTLIPPGPWLRTDFRSGPGGGYAAVTPVTDGRLVYCVFGSSVMTAVDFDGKVAWRREIVPFSFDVTVGSSPVLYGDTVLMFCASAKPEDSRLVAFDKANGKTKWEQKLPGTGFGHSTPLMIQVNGQDQLLVLASGMREDESALQALDPADGKRIWWCRGAGDAASPVYGDGLVYFDSGRGSMGVAVDPTGTGDVSKTHIRWTIQRVSEAIGSPIIVGPYLYRLHAPGVLKCFEMKTGKQAYSHRLEGIQTTWASPIATPDGRIFFANAGRSYVIQGGPEFKTIAVNDLGDSNHPSPAVGDGRMFVVGMKRIYCVGLPR